MGKSSDTEPGLWAFTDELSRIPSAAWGGARADTRCIRCYLAATPPPQ
ncbi:MAG: hypothetical protein HYV63_08645 [Candidatus Schekmanbacteria bacterium]|nr:hypothetical protein [Candidatus Schekmanbacteria bacterium]